MTDKPRVSLRRLIDEAMNGVTQKSSKSLLTIIGVALGIGAFVAVLGVTSSANGQISQDFNRNTATKFSIHPVEDATERDGSLFPPGAEARLARLNGVARVATTWDASVTDVAAVYPHGPDDTAEVPVRAASPNYLASVKARVLHGRVFDDALRALPVAVVGEEVVKQFGAGLLGPQPVLFLDGRAVSVVGIVRGSATEPGISQAIFVPDQYARDTLGKPGVSEQITVISKLGARNVLKKQLALAIDPINPEWYRVIPPPAPTVARDQVAASVQGLFIALAGITLFVGAVGIANSSLIGVMSRTPEIGLRRALGALPRHILVQFLLESAIRGLLGGALGAMAGLLVIVAVAVARSWTPVFDVWIFLIAPLIGAFVGGCAGLYPALRAARIEPVEAFRRQ